jgi:hypothetical protein
MFTMLNIVEFEDIETFFKGWNCMQNIQRCLTLQLEW